MPETLTRPTDAELEILTVLWSRTPTRVRDVHDNICKRKPAQYTMVLKMSQITTEKDLVRRDEKQRAISIRPRGRASGRSASLQATCCSGRSPGRRTP
jgi:predicted transcriptional regulator